jgi:hypothetical protein
MPLSFVTGTGGPPEAGAWKIGPSPAEKMIVPRDPHEADNGSIAVQISCGTPFGKRLRQILPFQ